MTEEEERDQVRQRTEQNRKAVPASVVRALAAMSLSLDDVLTMPRQEFDVLNRKLYEQKMSDDDRRHLIRFKHDSMTHAENLVYFEPTDAEWEEIEKDEL
jgi:hypothetical protein